MKRLTREQVEARKEKAVRFVRDVLGDSDRADEIADESLEDYAERRRITLINPFGKGKFMATVVKSTKTKAELEDEIRELEEENQELQDQLDAIADIVAPEDEGDDDGDGEGDDGADDPD